MEGKARNARVGCRSRRPRSSEPRETVPATVPVELSREPQMAGSRVLSIVELKGIEPSTSRVRF